MSFGYCQPYGVPFDHLPPPQLFHLQRNKLHAVLELSRMSESVSELEHSSVSSSSRTVRRVAATAPTPDGTSAASSSSSSSAATPCTGTRAPQRIQAPRRVVKEDFQRIACFTLQQAASEPSGTGRNQRVHAPSPLDTIPSNMYTRFPRFSTTTEGSMPDLSAEEVTSTRLSVDEQAMVHHMVTSAVPHIGKRQKVQKALHSAISTPSLGYKTIKDRLRRAPSTTLSGRTLQPETLVEDQSPYTNGNETGPITATSRSCSPVKSSNSSQQATDENTPPGSIGSNDRPRASSGYGFGPFVTSVNTYYTARDRFSRPPSGFLGRPFVGVSLEHNLGRSISLGSIDELRSNSFKSTSQRVFSHRTVPSRNSSLPTIESASAQQRTPRPVTVCDVEDVRTLSQLRKDPLFVDLQEGHPVDFILPPSIEDEATPLMSYSMRSTRSFSHRNIRSGQIAPLLVRSTSIRQDLDRMTGQQKIPMFVPSEIIKPGLSRPKFPSRVSSMSATVTATQVESADVIKEQLSNNSNEALTEASDWSTTAQLNPHGFGSVQNDEEAEPGMDEPFKNVRWTKAKRLLNKITRRQTFAAAVNSKSATLADGKKEKGETSLKKTCGIYARHCRRKSIAAMPQFFEKSSRTVEFARPSNEML